MSFGNFGSKPMKTPQAPKVPGKKPFTLEYREPVAVDGKYVMSRPTIYAMAGDAFGVLVEYEIKIPFELFNRKITDITVPITIVSQFKQK